MGRGYLYVDPQCRTLQNLQHLSVECDGSQLKDILNLLPSTLLSLSVGMIAEELGPALLSVLDAASLGKLKTLTFTFSSCYRFNIMADEVGRAVVN